MRGIGPGARGVRGIWLGARGVRGTGLGARSEHRENSSYIHDFTCKGFPDAVSLNLSIFPCLPALNIHILSRKLPTIHPDA